MLTLLVFCLPTILYVVWRARAGDDRGEAIADAGAVPGTLRDYGWGLLLLIPVSLIGWAAMEAVPADVRAQFGTLGAIVSPLSIMLMLVGAAGREILFRGLIGGVLVRRLGFAAGDAIQALLGALPSLSLLAADVRLWPIVVGQVLSGWLLGWLRTRLGTCFPGIPASGFGAVIASALAAL